MLKFEVWLINFSKQTKATVYYTRYPVAVLDPVNSMQQLSLLAGLLTKSLTFPMTLTIFQDAECSKLLKLWTERCRFCAMINAPFLQSLTSTRATLPVWCTSPQIESSPHLSCLLFIRTWYHHSSQGSHSHPRSFSPIKLSGVTWLWQWLPNWLSRFRGQRRYSSEPFPCWEGNDQSLCATELA